MLDLVVLFTVFLGLVGILLLVHWRERTGGSACSDDLKEQLGAWLEEAGQGVPTVEEVVGVLNREAARQQIRGEHENWRDLKITGLLPGTELPQFTIRHIEEMATHSIQVVVGVEWPMCVPGVGVAVTLGAGQRVSCHMQVDWMYDELRVRLSQEGRSSECGLLLGVEHTKTPKMALSCLVATPGVEHPESLASSVADAIHRLYGGLSLSQEELQREGGNGSAPVVPVVLVSAPEEEEENCHDNSEQQESTVERETTDVQPQTLPDPTREEGTDDVTDHITVEQGVPSSAEPEQLDVEMVQLPTETQLQCQEESKEEGSSQSKEEGSSQSKEEGSSQSKEDGSSQSKEDGSSQSKEDGSSQSVGSGVHVASSLPEGHPQVSPHLTSEPQHPPHLHPLPSSSTLPPSNSLPTIPSPSSPTWRRSPSYEQLLQITLPPIAESLVPERRALTLSYAGSDTTFGEDSQLGSDASFPSLLVFEVNDSQRVRHLVALSPAHATKLRRQLSHAKKLHIINGHVFTATHLKLRLQCDVCEEKIAGRFGKQGYSCRQCNMVVHKKCHWKVEGQCSKSTVTSMNLIYPDSVSTVSTV